MGDGGDVLEAVVDREVEQPLGAGRRAFEGGQELGRSDEVAFALQRPEEAVGALALVVEQVVEGEKLDGVATENAQYYRRQARRGYRRYYRRPARRYYRRARRY